MLVLSYFVGTLHGVLDLCRYYEGEGVVKKDENKIM